MRYIALFVLIQLVSLLLTLVGIPLIGLLVYFHAWTPLAGKMQWQGGIFTWLWGNEENGIVGPGMALTRWNAFYWSALRNPCNNLRFFPGVSKIGRPLWRKTWGAQPGGFYVQAGWNLSGYPVLSGGRNINAPIAST